MGPEATYDLFRSINLTEAKKDQEHLHIIIVIIQKYQMN